jgi:hypothetical protein
MSSIYYLCETLSSFVLALYGHALRLESLCLVLISELISKCNVKYVNASS